MAGKVKRLCKLFNKKGLNGIFKPVGTLEKAHVVIIDDKQSMDRMRIIHKDTYQGLLDDNYVFPSDMVHYVVITNPRNRRNIEQWLFTHENGSVTQSFTVAV